MQLNISHEVTTTETKTVDVELPYYSAFQAEYSDSVSHFCILPDERILEVYIGDLVSHFTIYKKSDAEYGYKQPLKKALLGGRSDRAEFLNAYYLVNGTIPSL